MGRTSIVVVTYNHAAVVGACVRALEAAGMAPGTVRLFLVDNASADGTADVIRREVLAGGGASTRGGLPAELIASAENLGFAGGNNLALRRAIEDGDEFAYLLNPDTEVEPGFLETALAAARGDGTIAAVQSLLVRHPDTGVVNTWGNAIHFLGFGYAAGDGTPLAAVEAAPHLAGVHDVAYASGAGVLLRVAALREIGLLAEELFAYHEDLELSWRARLAGWRVVAEPRSRVAHKYAFARGAYKWYLLERNRALVLAWCCRWRTLFLLAPALVVMEVALLLFALRGGWAREKWRAWAYVLGPSRWARLRETRRRVQALRRVGDREATRLHTGAVIFPSMSPWLLVHVANPVLSAYWRACRVLMRW